MELEQYFQELQNTVRAATEVSDGYTVEAFIGELSERLSEADEIDNLSYGYFDGEGKNGKRLRFDSYDFGEEQRELVIGIADYSFADELETLSTPDATKLFSALEAFVSNSITWELSKTLEPASVGYSVSAGIFERRNELDKVRLYLFTNKKLSERIKEFPSKHFEGVELEFHLWDIERLFIVENSKMGRESLEVKLTDWEAGGIPALRTNQTSDHVQTYLSVVPGEILANIYSKFGSRVLEANVRSFLSARGNVNKGIRGTIMQEPEMFLAYNNGITATAAEIKTHMNDGVLYIDELKDLQIVNGGQTTASLFYVRRNDKRDLSDVNVQMKLIIVEDARSSDLVPLISRYANSQNKVSEADFFSNHPFHVRMEEMSKQVYAPAKPGVRFATRWYYERVRSQYQSDKAKLGVAESRKFEATNPKSQMITKTEAAKYLSTWDQKPHIVSQGAQKVFLDFAKFVDSSWNSDPNQFNEAFYRALVAKGIIFENLRLSVMKSDWYAGGYLANIVAYTVAKFSNIISESKPGYEFDFEKIWQAQSIDSKLLSHLVEMASVINDELTNEKRPNSNVGEWAKSIKFWDLIKAKQVDIGIDLEDFLVSKSESKARKDDAKKTQKLDSGISAQISVMESSSTYWEKALSFGREQNSLTESEIDYFTKLSNKTQSQRVLLEWQAKKALEALERIKNIGFVGN